MADGTVVMVGGWWGGKKEKSIVESDGNPYTAVGRGFFGVQGFLSGKVDKKRGYCPFRDLHYPKLPQWWPWIGVAWGVPC